MHETHDALSLEDLVLEYLDRTDGDSDEPAGEVLDELCRVHPAHASALRARIDTLRATGLLPLPEDDLDDALPEHIAGHRVVRRLGAGGMGVVYLAEEEQLARFVALKVLRGTELLSPGSRARFAREIEVVARLAHPGIAAVYARGNADLGGGQPEPYFTMEHVPGVGLDGLLRALAGRDVRDVDGRTVRALLPPTGSSDEAELDTPLPPLFRGGWVEIATRIALDVAHALAHAHERGVVHRDVKPSNILLTRDGRVVLVDFGLALLADASRLTRTGLELGSLAYLPPEVLENEQADPGERGDVYALGLVLYELLTLAPAHAGGSPRALRARILAGAPVPLRQRNPAIARDVSVVCETALARDLERRYASMSDFAVDLENLLALRPIRARRPGASERLALWTRRHPASAVAIVLGCVVVLGGPLLFGWMQSRALKETSSLNLQLEQALGEAHRNAEETRAAFELFTRAGRDLLLDVPHGTDAMRAFLMAALEHHEAVLARRGDDPSSALEVAHARRNAGWIEQRLGRLEAAAAHYADAGDRYTHALALARSAVAPETPLVRLEYWLLDVRRTEALLLHERRMAEEAVQHLEPIVAGLGAPPRGLGAAPLLLERSRARDALAMLLDAVGRGDEVPAMIEAARAELEAAAVRNPELAATLEWKTCEAGLAEALGTHYAVHGNTEAAILELERALEIRRVLNQDSDLRRDASGHELACRANLGSLFDRQGDLEGAAQQYTAAVELAEELHRDFPATVAHTRQLVGALANAGIIELKRGRQTEAWVLLDRALAKARQMVAEHDGTTDGHLLANLLCNFAQTALRSGRIEQAGAHLAEALETLEELLTDEPGNEQLLQLQDIARMHSAYVELASGDPRAAAESVLLVRAECRDKQVLLNACDAAARAAGALRGDNEAENRTGARDEELAARCAAASIAFARRAIEERMLPPDLRTSLPGRFLAGTPGWDELLQLEAAARAEKAAYDAQRGG